MTAPAARSAARRSPIFRSSGIANGSSSIGVSNRAVCRRAVVEGDAVAEGGRGRPGDPHGEGGDAVGLVEVQAVRGREAPRPVDEDADAEALRFARGDALDAAAT